jgi:copper homeostasis protein (lipoprotein)
MRFVDRKTAIICILFVVLLGINYLLYIQFQGHPPSSSHVEVYSGVLPCTDCDGVKATLLLSRDTDAAGGTYVLQTEYLGKKAATIELKGDWTTLPPSTTTANAAIVALNPSRNEETLYFVREGNGSLTPLDKNQNRIKSGTSYSLQPVLVEK